MGKATKGSSGRSIFRLLIWEILAIAGYLHVRVDPLVTVHGQAMYLYNALFFLGAYPVLFLIRWKFQDGCLGTVLTPISWVLGICLGFSTMIWIVYGLMMGEPRYGDALINHTLVFGAFFLFVYFPVLQPVLGTTVRYYPFPALIWIVFFSGLGGFLGYLLGHFAESRFGGWMGPGHEGTRFLLWLALIFLGMAAGALAARRRQE